MTKERAFYCLNEQFVSNITGDMIFSARSLERFGNKHLASDLPMRAKQRIFTIGAVTRGTFTVVNCLFTTGNCI